MSVEKKIAIYPGSFDPITNGHLDVLKTASGLFDKVIIAVSNNSAKKSFLSIEDRIKLINLALEKEEMANVESDFFEGLTVNYAQEKGAKVLIRGLRAVSDFEFEMQLSQANLSLNSEIKTVFLTTKPKYNFISSSVVKEVLQMGGDISKFVPKAVKEYLQAKNLR